MPEMSLTCPNSQLGSACPCRLLLDPWNVENPPDAVCVDTARASVRRWAEAWWHDRLLPLISTQTGAIPASMGTIAATRPGLADLLTKLEQHQENVALLDRWPFPAQAGQILLVVQQWVQEAPNETLANQMTNDPLWTGTTDRLRKRHYKDSAFPGEQVQKLWSDRLVDDIIRLLADCQIPVTPANIGFTLATVVDESDLSSLPAWWQRLVLYRDRDRRPLPARGFQVSTLVFADLQLVDIDVQPPNDQQVSWQVQPNAELTIKGDLAHLTGPFVEHRLSPTLLAHRNFAARLARHPFTLPRARRQAQPGSFAVSNTREEPVLDYVEEALQAARELIPTFDPAPAWRFDRAIEQLLDKTRSRVAQRRRRAKMSPTPPKGWRSEAKRRIREELTS